jgi:hypothetical protein
MKERLSRSSSLAAGLILSHDELNPFPLCVCVCVCVCPRPRILTLPAVRYPVVLCFYWTIFSGYTLNAIRCSERTLILLLL